MARDTKSKLAKVVGIVNEGEEISLRETIAYSTGAAVLLPFAGSGLGAVISNYMDHGLKAGAIAGAGAGGFAALLVVTELIRKYREGRRRTSGD